MTPQKQLEEFILKLSPGNAELFSASLSKMRALFPEAVQMVYDNYNALVVGFGPTDRASEAIFSLAGFAGGVSLCFLQQGPKLKDPNKILRGAGKIARNVRLESAADLDKPEIKALMSQALTLASCQMAHCTEARLIIKSVSVKQRPRRSVGGI